MPVWNYSRRESRARAHLDRQVLCLDSENLNRSSNELIL